MIIPYKCTVLKELPNYPIGTIFYMMTNHKKYYSLKFPEDGKYYWRDWFRIPKDVIENPEWVKQEINPNCITELSCPKCGSTRCIIDWIEDGSSWDGDVDYYYHAIMVSCVDCGEERKLFRYPASHKVRY